MEIFESFDQFINYDDINLDLKAAKLNLLNNISRHDKKYKDVIDFIIESNLVNEVYSLNEILNAFLFALLEVLPLTRNPTF